MSTETETPVPPDTAAAPAADATANVAQAAEPARSTSDAPAVTDTATASPADAAQTAKSAPDTATPAATPAAAPTDRPPRTSGRGPNRRGDAPAPREGGPRREGGDRERRGPRRERPAFTDPNAPEMVEKIVYINRCAKVVKGGRRFSFAALAVVGDKKGSVGIGYGKANEVPDAIKKSTEHAKKRMVNVKLKGDTIPHEVYGEYDGGRVLLRPAVTGTGLIAGGAVRAVLEAAGIKHILTKSMGSKNHIAVVHATLNGLRKLRLADQIKTARTTTVAPAE